MIIKRIAFGNSLEAYVENNLKDGINLIYSCPQNNKGKTVVFQSLFYGLGSEAKFPRNFDNDKSNYYYVELYSNNELFKICRRKDTYVVKSSDNLLIFDSQSDFKRFYHKYIDKLPVIILNGKSKIIDLYLYNHAFFVGQDVRDTSDLNNAGQYNKKDFENMLVAMAGLNPVIMEVENLAKIREDISELNQKRKELINKNKILNSSKYSLHLSSYTVNKNRIDGKLKSLDNVKEEIVDLTNRQNKYFKRISKNEILIRELNELNKELEQGHLKCGVCGSTDIIYESKGVEFEVSNIDIRRQILNTLNGRIESCNEEIAHIQNMINLKQNEVNELLKDDDITLENLLFFKSDILQSLNSDEEIKIIDSKISDLKDILDNVDKINIKTKEDQIKILSQIRARLNVLYSLINIDGNSDEIDLFTKRTEVISGSEGAAFHIARLLTIQEIISHNHPIAIDCFRDGELSSEKEDIVLELFKKSGNQVLLSATLKELEIDKYENLDYINKIDYSDYMNSHILSANFVNEFKEMLKDLSIKI